VISTTAFFDLIAFQVVAIVDAGRTAKLRTATKFMDGSETLCGIDYPSSGQLRSLKVDGSMSYMCRS